MRAAHPAGRRVDAVPNVVPEVVLARDLPSASVRAAVAAGALRRVGRGTYLPETSGSAPESSPSDARRVLLARAHGTHRRLRAEHVFSHTTAAVLWGLPLWRTPTQTAVLVRHSGGAGADPQIRRRPGLPSTGEVTERHGLPVTSLERTLVDCARELPPVQALVVADGALRAGASREVALEILDACGRRPGVAKAREVLLLADPGAESPGETVTRFVVLRDGFPVPTTQHPVRTRIGTFWTDLGWEELRLAVEYDGRMKYTGREDLIREKRRHDAIVESGTALLRVTKEDIARRDLTRRILDTVPPGRVPELRPRRLLRG